VFEYKISSNILAPTTVPFLFLPNYYTMIYIFSYSLALAGYVEDQVRYLFYKKKKKKKKKSRAFLS
jgi:hypothetical protein